jgi:hypothetical protein
VTGAIEDPDGAATAAVAFLSSVVGGGGRVAGRSTQSDDGTVTVPVRLATADEGDDPALLPLTVVSLRPEGDAFVPTGASTDQVQVATPAPNDTISSPVALSGKANAFEGYVQVQVRQGGDPTGPVLGESVVQGSGTDELGPFEGRIEFGGATPGPGWLTFFVPSEGDGQVLQATVVPVTLG